MSVRYIVEKRFTSGPLKGLSANDEIRFVDHFAAKTWLEGVQRNIRQGRLEYKVVAFYEKHNHLAKFANSPLVSAQAYI